MNQKTAAILLLSWLPLLAMADDRDGKQGNANAPVSTATVTTPTDVPDTTAADTTEPTVSTADTAQEVQAGAPGDTITVFDAKGVPYRIPASSLRITIDGGQRRQGQHGQPGRPGSEQGPAPQDGGQVPPPPAASSSDSGKRKKLFKRDRIDREIMKSTFIPKGSWMGGATLSYSNYDNDNLNILVFKDIEGDGYSVSVSPFAGYFIKDNVMVGVRFAYNRNHFDLESFELNLGEDFNISLDNLYWLEQKYEVSGIFRTYMPIGRSKIFGLFNEVRLTYGYSTGKNSTGTGSEYDGTYEKAHHLQIGFAPGLTAFVTNWSAVEVSMGVMGYGFKWSNQTTNQVESGKHRSQSGNFKINLFSINIGMTFYL